MHNVSNAAALRVPRCVLNAQDDRVRVGDEAIAHAENCLLGVLWHALRVVLVCEIMSVCQYFCKPVILCMGFHSFFFYCLYVCSSLHLFTSSVFYFPPVSSLSLSLSLTHTHTHTHLDVAAEGFVKLGRHKLVEVDVRAYHCGSAAGVAK